MEAFGMGRRIKCSIPNAGKCRNSGRPAIYVKCAERSSLSMGSLRCVGAKISAGSVRAATLLDGRSKVPFSVSNQLRFDRSMRWRSGWLISTEENANDFGSEGKRWLIRYSEEVLQAYAVGTSAVGEEDGSMGELSPKITPEAKQALLAQVEICMGKKCRKSGAEDLLEAFRRSLGADGTVSQCKCLEKCREGPNIRVSTSTKVSVEGQEGVVELTVPPIICVGISVEDVEVFANTILERDFYE